MIHNPINYVHDLKYLINTNYYTPVEDTVDVSKKHNNYI